MQDSFAYWCLKSGEQVPLWLLVPTHLQVFPGTEKVLFISWCPLLSWPKNSFGFFPYDLMGKLKLFDQPNTQLASSKCLLNWHSPSPLSFSSLCLQTLPLGTNISTAGCILARDFLRKPFPLLHRSGDEALALKIFFLFNFIYLFIFGCAGSLLLRGPFSSSRAQGSLSSCAEVSHCGGFLCCRAWAPGARPQWLWCTGLVAPQPWDLPRSGIKPMSPALPVRFFTTEPPGKSRTVPFNMLSMPIRVQ